MKGSKSFTISTPSPQYRSGEGRRMPYHVLQRGQHIDDDSLLYSETETREFLSDYEKPGKPLLQGLEEWDKAHRRLMDWFYSPDAPCLVDPTSPNQYLEFLTESSTASRVRGQQAVLQQAYKLRDELKSPTLGDAMSRWKSLTPQGRRELVLKTLGDRARQAEASPGDSFARVRKLIPEVNVERLCSDEGEGLVHLINLLREDLSNPDEISSQPIYNEMFFKKFAIPTSTTSLPLSKADRAMQEEFVLRRHSSLFTITTCLLATLLDQAIPEQRGIGNFASDFTINNSAPLVPSVISTKGSFVRCASHVEECCSICYQTAAEVGIPRILYCPRCRNIGRNQPYCSRACQKSDWISHKTTGGCGTKLSDLRTVPIIAHEPSQLSSHPLRFAVFDWLNAHPLDTWLVHDSDGTKHAICFEAAPATLKMTSTLRALAFSALRNSDQRAIALLSRVLVVVSQLRRHDPSADQDYRRLSLALEAQFRSMFFLNKDTDWTAAMVRGEMELERGDNDVLNDWYRFKVKTAAMDLRVFVLDQLDRDPDLVWAVHSTKPFRLALDDSQQRRALRQAAYKALTSVAHSTQVDLLASVLVDTSLVGADWSSELERKEQPSSPRDTLEKQFRLIFDLEKDKEWDASLERGQVEIEKVGNEVLKGLYETLQDELNVAHNEAFLADLNLPDPSDPLYPFIRGMFETALGPTKNRSEADIAADMFGVTDPAVKKGLGEFIESQKLEKQRKEAEDKKDSEVKENEEGNQKHE